MKNINLLLATLTLLLAGCGCTNTPRDTNNGYPRIIGATTTHHKYAPILPEGAKIIQNLGNGWIVFELNIDGKTRKFLHATYQTHGISGGDYYTVGTTTQLTD